LHKLKRNSLFKSFRFRAVIILIFLTAVIVLLFVGKVFKKGDSSTQTQQITENKPTGGTTPNPDVTADKCDKDIDSILFNFGLKKEWIKTAYPSIGRQQEESSKQRKQENLRAKWFVKEVSIPKDLTTAEVNLDLSSYINFLGLKDAVKEDIRTTAISFTILTPDDTSQEKLPLAKISITPTDKIKREPGTLVLIINQINDFKKEELENILNTSNEFSFIFPRNPEEIELQNKLIQMKKDVLINLTVGTGENIDADFRIGMDDKEIKQRVKSITSDFPSVKSVILSKADKSVPNDVIFSLASEELRKNGIIAYRDTMLTELLNKNEQDADNKIQLIVSRLKEKTSVTGKVISILNFSGEEFLDFYSAVQNLKKRGYKFYTLTQFLNKEEERLQKEKEKKEDDLKKQIKEKTEKKKTKQKQTNKKKKK
jgi:hypothetical protein